MGVVSFGEKYAREIAGVYIGDRSGESAQKLRDSLPLQYRENATCYTDFWQAYNCAIPNDRHHSVGKETGLTNHIERFNFTRRLRVSGLVRKTLFL